VYDTTVVQVDDPSVGVDLIITLGSNAPDREIKPLG
jgi:hypothetical protein